MKSAIFATTVLFLAACAPLHIKEHQVREKLDGPYLYGGIEGKCGQGSTSYALIHPSLVSADVNVRGVNEDRQLELTLTVEGKDNAQLSVEQGPVKVKYGDGRVFPVLPTLTSYHHKFSAADQGNSSKSLAPGANERLSFDEAYIFKVESGYAKNVVELRAVFPYAPTEFEVELPDVEIDWDSIGPLVLKYSYVDKWGLYRVIGCN